MGNGTDSLSWIALGGALTVAGLLASALVWMRRGPGRGLRWAGASLLPLAAALTGLLRLVAEIADALGAWAVRLVFSPVVWLGVVLAGVAVVLWVVGGFLTRRSGRSGPSSAAPAPSPERRPQPGRARKSPAVEDQDDIEAILRKHGIQ